MTITLSPETESYLQERAQSEGGDLNNLADAIMRIGIEWDKREREAITADVLRGDEDVAAGRVKSLARFIEDKRAKFGFSANWPHDVDMENDNGMQA
jgi:hypothetical protein